MRSKSGKGGSGTKKGGGKPQKAQVKAAKAAAKKAKAAQKESGGGAGDGPKLSKSDALAAAAAQGVTFTKKGKVANAKQARKIAEGAAVSAAAAMGVNIMKANGKIDTAKARAAVSGALGFSINKDGKAAQREAAEAAQAAAVKMAESLGADILNDAGKVDIKKAQAVADLALTPETSERLKMGRQEALTILNGARDGFTAATKKTREEAADTLEKLLGASVVKDGQVDAEAALKVREAAVTLAKTDEFLAQRKKMSRRQAAGGLDNLRGG